MGAINTLFNTLLNQYFLLHLNDTLMVDSLDEEDDYRIRINKEDSVLYCVELVSGGNTANFLSDEKVSNIFENYAYAKNGIIYQAYLKKGLMQRNLIFSSNHEILELIAKGVDGKFLKDGEIINALYDLFLDNKYSVRKKELKSSFQITEELDYTNLSHSFNGFAKEAIYKNFKDVKLYQSFKVKNRKSKINLSYLFSLNFEGVIWTVVNFHKDDVNFVLSSKRKQAKADGIEQPLKELQEAYNGNDIDLALLNSSIFLLSGNNNAVTEIGNSLGIEYIEKHIDKLTYLKNTPIIVRDGYFDVLVEKEFFEGYFSCVHKEDVPNPNIYGVDINGRHWNFRFDQTTAQAKNKSSSFAILGVTGSGKTTFTNGILAQTFNFSLSKDRLIRIGDTDEGMRKNKLRHFDVKQSGKVLARLMHKEYPEQVVLVNTSLNEYAYNPINIKKIIDNKGNVTIDQDELTLNIYLLSIVLEAKNRDGERGLKADEQALFKAVVTNIYETGAYKCDYIIALKDDNKEVYERLLELGYSQTDNIINIKHDGFDFLKVPLLRTVIKALGTISEKGSNQHTKDIAFSLLAKLEQIQSIGIFNSYDKFDYEQATILNVDFDPIKDLDEYVPVFLSTFLKTYRMDRKNQRELKAKGLERPYITYIFEEAKNVLSQKSFDEFLAKFTNEARSDRIKIGFTTQLVEHIPEHILAQIENKFLLFPAKNKRNQLIADVARATKPDEKTIALMQRTPEFGVVLWNEHGSSSIKLALTEEEIEAYGQAQ